MNTLNNLIFHQAKEWLVSAKRKEKFKQINTNNNHLKNKWTPLSAFKQTDKFLNVSIEQNGLMLKKGSILMIWKYEIKSNENGKETSWCEKIRRSLE